MCIVLHVITLKYYGVEVDEKGVALIYLTNKNKAYLF